MMLTVTARPITLLVAAGLLILIGVSGFAVGVELMGVFAPSTTSVGIAAAVGGYGLAAVVSGVALALLRRWGWWLALVIIGIGIAVLAGIQAAEIGSGVDSVILTGFVVWGVTLALLVAPPTRHAAGVQ
jgi:hypothetical protein